MVINSGCAKNSKRQLGIKIPNKKRKFLINQYFYLVIQKSHRVKKKKHILMQVPEYQQKYVISIMGVNISWEVKNWHR